MRRLKLTGKVFGRLKVMRFYRSKKGRSYWECRCNCGKIIVVIGRDLISGGTQSCGCLQKEISSKINKEVDRSYLCGKNNHNYNPNLTAADRVGRMYIPGYVSWRTEVYKLDFWTCRRCGYKGDNLNAHHIESYRANPELRTEVSNGITLCETCHKDFHHQYGYGDNTRAQLIEFFKGEVYAKKEIKSEREENYQ